MPIIYAVKLKFHQFGSMNLADFPPVCVISYSVVFRNLLTHKNVSENVICAVDLLIAATLRIHRAHTEYLKLFLSIFLN